MADLSETAFPSASQQQPGGFCWAVLVLRPGHAEIGGKADWERSTPGGYVGFKSHLDEARCSA
jgi:hypothetical protein